MPNLLDDQLSYYRELAPDYDDLAAGYMQWVRDPVIDFIKGAGLRGHVVEFACGTGLWTSVLSGVADRVTAVDGAPEMLRIAGKRGLHNVGFLRANLFDWTPPQEWDGAFFANWHSHVPPQRLGDFWAIVDRAVQHRGPVVFLDATAPEHDDGVEMTLPESDLPLVRRQLNDGRSFEIVKTYWDPDELLAELMKLGWRGSATVVEMPGARDLALYRVSRADH